jgi:hypothetical protein
MKMRLQLHVTTALHLRHATVYPKISGLAAWGERELQMVQLTGTRSSCIAIL